LVRGAVVVAAGPWKKNYGPALDLYDPSQELIAVAHVYCEIAKDEFIQHREKS
jgi:hypothetical protein